MHCGLDPNASDVEQLLLCDRLEVPPNSLERASAIASATVLSYIIRDGSLTRSICRNQVNNSHVI
jgi:hypothetical protein